MEKDLAATRPPYARAGAALSSRWLVLVPLFLMWFFGQADKTNISVVIAFPDFLRDMNFAPHSIGLGALMTYFLLGYGISTVIWGFVIDLLPSRSAALVAALTWGIALAWFGLAESHASLYLSRFLLGLGEGALYPLSNSLVSHWFPFRQRGGATSIWWCGVGAGPSVLTPLFALAMVSMGWRSSFIGFGILQVVVLVPLILLVVRDAPEEVAAGPWTAGRSEPDDLPEAGRRLSAGADRSALFFLRSRVYWGNVLCNVANGQASWGSTTWLLTYLFVVRHYTLVQSGLFVGLGFFLNVVITLVVGFGSDRHQRRAPYGMFLYGFIIVAMGVAVLSPSPLLSALAVAAVIGTVNSAAIVFQALLHSYIPRPSMGRASGLMSFVNNTLAAASPVIIGALVGIHDNWGAAFVWLAFWPLLGLCLMTWFRRLGL